MRIAGLIASALLVGCASQPTVTITVPEYVAVPEALLGTYPCGEATILTNGDLLAAYATCVESKALYDANVAAVRGLGTEAHQVR